MLAWLGMCIQRKLNDLETSFDKHCAIHILTLCANVSSSVMPYHMTDKLVYIVEGNIDYPSMI